MTRILDLVRRGVLATNHVPVLGRINRIPYHLAIRSLAARVAAIPGVASLHVRGSFARDAWVPGRSDIDLTAVIRAGLPAKADIEAARRTRAEIDDARRRYPMIGEVEVLNAGHVAAYATPGWRRHEISRWKRIQGEPLVFPSQSAFEEPLAQALAFYDYASKSLLAGGSTRTLERAAAKIFRMIGPAAAATFPSGVDRASWVAHVLPVLHRAAVESAVECTFDARTLARMMPEPSAEPVPVPSDLESQWHAFSGGAAVPWQPGSPLLVLRDGLSAESIAAAARAAFSAYESPTLWTAPTLAAFGQLTEPINMLAVHASHQAIGGSSIVPLPLFPSHEAFHRAYAVHVSRIFPDVYSGIVQEAGGFHDFVFGWLLRAVRYFEDGTLDFDYSSLAQYHSGAGRPLEADDTPEGRFALLRTLASALATTLTRHSDDVDVR